MSSSPNTSPAGGPTEMSESFCAKALLNLEPARGLEPAERAELVEARLRYATRRAVLSVGEP